MSDLMVFGWGNHILMPEVADAILDEILIAESLGHSLQRETVTLAPDVWIGRCERCGYASVIHLSGTHGQYGGVLNRWLKKPCLLNLLMFKMGVEPATADLMDFVPE